MKANRLQLNPTKTEILWCASSRRQHLIPTESVRVGNVSVSPVTAVRDLDVYIDTDVSMRTHVTNTMHRACFSAMRQIRSVRRALPQHALLTLVRSLVITKLDRCTSVLAGITRYLQDRLQSVLNATHVRRHSIQLNCFGSCTGYASRFRLCVLAYHCVHGTAPAYLADSLRLTSEVAARRRLRSVDSPTMLVLSTRRYSR